MDDTNGQIVFSLIQTTSINTDLVVPLEDKLEREQPNITVRQNTYDYIFMS